MNAIILAGGKGTRMKEYSSLPKVLLPIGKTTILGAAIEKLILFGVTTTYVTLSYKSEMISKELDKYRKRINIIEILDDVNSKGNTPGILNSLKLSKETTLICYGDTVFDLPLDEMLEFHRKKESCITILCRRTDHPEDSDLVWYSNSKIQGSKYPHLLNDFSDKLGVSAFYIVEPQSIARSSYVDINCDWFSFLIRQIKSNTSRIELYELKTGMIKDIGTPNRYMNYLDYLESEKSSPG